MAKAKTPKFGLSLFTSFQICRPKKPSSMIKSPLPLPLASYMISPLNSKQFDISFPGTPLPPPSTPSKTTPTPRLGCEFPSSSSPTKKKDKNTKYKSKSSLGDETDSLFSSPPSFNHHPPLTTTARKPRRFKRYGSKEWREGEEHNDEKKPMVGKLLLAPCMEQSFVVVKKSVDPYEDFKKSMSEMIVEKQIFEPKELEQLLMSFLSLNSRLHHKIIIEAFTQILKDVF